MMERSAITLPSIAMRAWPVALSNNCTWPPRLMSLPVTRSLPAGVIDRHRSEQCSCWGSSGFEPAMHSSRCRAAPATTAPT